MTETEIAYRYWIDALEAAFPEMKSFARPKEFIEQMQNHIRLKENAALQRAINVLRHDNERKHRAAIILVRSCMKGEDIKGHG